MARLQFWNFVPQEYTIYNAAPDLSVQVLGSLNDDGVSKKKKKKAIGLYQQNNNFARASRFLYIS